MVQKLPSLQSEWIVSQWLPWVSCWWGQLVFFQGLLLLIKTHRDESENQSIGQCSSRIKCQSNRDFKIPPGNARAFDCRSFQRVGNLNLAWVGWSSPSGWIHVFYLLIWRCLKVNSSLSQEDGSEGKVYKRVISADLVSCKKIGHQIWHLSRVFERMPEEFMGGGGCWSFWIDRHLTDKKTIWTEARAKPKSASWYVYMMTPCTNLNFVSSFNAISAYGLVFRWNL